MRTEKSDHAPRLISDLEGEERLVACLRALPGVAVAFSGGVDSSYLLSVALEARGGAVRAFLGVSPSLGRDQHEWARAVASELRVPLEEIATAELELEAYRANQGDRCFYCKDTLFAAILSHLEGETLVEGTNQDDLEGHRPGMEAARLRGVRSPLVEAGLTKAAIRRLSSRRGLSTAEIPSSPCLSSRFPVGVPVNEEDLKRVEEAEACLRALGFSGFRVRHHGELARIEVARDQLALLAGTPLGDQVVHALEALGYMYVTLDLLGFRSGSSSYGAR
jgi:uncharacterized protein